jgi:Putative zinc-finger
MSCEEVRDRLSAFLDGELEVWQRRRLGARCAWASRPNSHATMIRIPNTVALHRCRGLMSFLLSLNFNSFVKKTSHRRKIFLIIAVRLPFLDELERSPGAWGMQACMVASAMKLPVRVEVPPEIPSSQFEHRFGHRLAPAHHRPCHAVLHQMPARPCDDPPWPSVIPCTT